MEELLQMLTRYIEGEWPAYPLPETFRQKATDWHTLHTPAKRAKAVAAVMSDICEQASDKVTFLRLLANTFHAYSKSAGDYQERIVLLKKALQHSKVVSWRWALLSQSHCEIDYNLYFQPLKFNNAATQPLTFSPSRFKQYKGKAGSFALIGSAFFTHKVPLHTQESHVLDALYSAYTPQHGLVFAIGDGVGGHVVDSQQDKQIARASHFATKHAVRLLSLYQKPEALLADVPVILKDLAQEVQQKAGLEATTLLCGHAFYEEGHYRLVGFSIGDSYVLAWDPAKKTVIPVVSLWKPSCGTAQFPGAYKPFEVQMFDCRLPLGTLLLPMTDGMTDELPQLGTTKTHPNGVSYLENQIDAAWLTALWQAIPADAPPEAYVKALMAFVIETLEGKRQQGILQQKVLQLGDDVLVAGFRLQKPTFWGHMAYFFQSKDKKGIEVTGIDATPTTLHPTQQASRFHL